MQVWNFNKLLAFANSPKLSKALKQFVGNLPTNLIADKLLVCV